MLEKSQKKYTCPVCGYEGLNEAPYIEGGGGSYEICPSCGFEYGVSDDDLGYTHEQWRQEWIEKGMSWYSQFRKKPVGWNPIEQLKNTNISLKN